MSTERKGVEFIVGLFLLIGLGAVGWTVVSFGRVGQGLKKYYELAVEFPNASGLASGADVLMAGARIGSVDGPPRLVKIGETYGVSVKLRISEGIAVPKEADIIVAQSGLLGDCYVDVMPHIGASFADAYAPGETVKGTRNTGLDDLTKKGGVLMDSLNEEVAEFKKLTTNLNDKLLSDENLTNLKDTFANLKTTSANFAESSKKLDGAITKIDSAAESAKGTMETAGKAVTDIQAVAGDLRKFADAGTKLIDTTGKSVETFRSLMQKAERGEGTLGLLLNDRPTADNMKTFIANLRRSGVLWYKDKPLAEPEPKPAPKRR